MVAHEETVTAPTKTAIGLVVFALTPTREPTHADSATPTEHTPAVDETDEPAATVTLRAVVETLTLTRTAAPETSTVMAVDTLTPTREPTLTDSVVPTERTPDVEVTDKPAETAIIGAVDETPAVTSTLEDALAETATIIAAPTLTATAFALPLDTATPTATVAERVRPTVVPATVVPGTDKAPASPAREPTGVIQTATITPTALPAVMAYMIATPTAYGSTAEDVEPACSVRDDWIPYDVKRGDTLLALALATNTDLITLREANCLSPINGILAGDSVVVPALPDLPLTMPEPVIPRATQEYRSGGCALPDVQIQSPLPGAQLSGIFAVTGRANVPEGGRYEIAIMPAWSEQFHQLLKVNISVEDNVIGLVNSEIFGPGLQRLRLALLDKDGSRLEDSVCEVPVVFLAP